MQYSHLKFVLQQQGADLRQVKVPVDLFHRLLTNALRAKGIFDESYYLQNNEDMTCPP